MVLTHASPTRLVFTHRRSLGPTLLSGTLLGVMGTLPLLALGPLTAGRIALCVVLYAVAGTLLHIARRRVEQLVVSLDRGTIEGDHASHPITRARFLSLSSTGSAEEHAQRGRYRVELVMEGPARLVLLERSDPAKVLADLRRLLRHWSLPVRSGWGLPDGAEPWKESGSPNRDRPSSPVVEHGAPFPNERGAGWCVLGGSIVIGTAMGIMHGARVEKGAPTALLSWFLSGVTLSLVVALAAFLLTDRVEARVEGDEVRVERRVVGVRVSQRVVRTGDVRGVYAVGVDESVPLHLLLDTQEGLESFPLTGEPARRFAQAFAV